MLKTIAAFKNKETHDFFYRKRIKKWEKFAKKALKVLFILNAANDLKELEFSFDARLHKLHGDAKVNTPLELTRSTVFVFIEKLIKLMRQKSLTTIKIKLSWLDLKNFRQFIREKFLKKK